jgi:hypothetical protein
LEKYKDIRIIREKSLSDSTYDNIKYKVNGEQTLKITIDGKKNDKYKKKKVVNKNESDKKFKALNFSKPSQRNHSSAYEDT